MPPIIRSWGIKNRKIWNSKALFNICPNILHVDVDADADVNPGV